MTEAQINTGTLLAEWISHCGDRPPKRVVSHVARELKALLDEGNDPAVVRAGLSRWHRKRLHPGALASVVWELRGDRG